MIKFNKLMTLELLVKLAQIGVGLAAGYVGNKQMEKMIEKMIDEKTSK